MNDESIYCFWLHNVWWRYYWSVADVSNYELLWKA